MANQSKISSIFIKHLFIIKSLFIQIPYFNY